MHSFLHNIRDPGNQCVAPNPFLFQIDLPIGTARVGYLRDQTHIQFFDLVRGNKLTLQSEVLRKNQDILASKRINGVDDLPSCLSGPKSAVASIWRNVITTYRRSSAINDVSSAGTVARYSALTLAIVTLC